MANLTLRSVKGSPLTNTEVDGNFTALNEELGAIETNKIALTDISVSIAPTAVAGGDLGYDNLTGTLTYTPSTGGGGSAELGVFVASETFPGGNLGYDNLTGTLTYTPSESAEVILSSFSTAVSVNETFLLWNVPAYANSDPAYANPTKRVFRIPEYFKGSTFSYENKPIAGTAVIEVWIQGKSDDLEVGAETVKIATLYFPATSSLQRFVFESNPPTVPPVVPEPYMVWHVPGDKDLNLFDSLRFVSRYESNDNDFTGIGITLLIKKALLP